MSDLPSLEHLPCQNDEERFCLDLRRWLESSSRLGLFLISENLREHFRVVPLPPSCRTNSVLWQPPSAKNWVVHCGKNVESPRFGCLIEKDGGGFASPVAPQEAANAALQNREIKAVYGIDRTQPLSEILNRYDGIC